MSSTVFHTHLNHALASSRHIHPHRRGGDHSPEVHRQTLQGPQKRHKTGLVAHPHIPDLPNDRIRRNYERQY